MEEGERFSHVEEPPCCSSLLLCRLRLLSLFLASQITTLITSYDLGSSLLFVVAYTRGGGDTASE